jgi:hypothetical protein
MRVQLSYGVIRDFMGTSSVSLGSGNNMVRFDDGSKNECSSALHRVEKMHTMYLQKSKCPQKLLLSIE